MEGTEKKTGLPIIVIDNFNNLQKLTLVTRAFLATGHNLFELFSKLHPAIAASVLQFLSSNERAEAIQNLNKDFDPQILSFLDEGVRESVLDLWAVNEIAQKLEKLEGQDAIKILEELNVEERKALLLAINPAIRIFLEEGLAYPEETAGRLMQHQIVALPQEWDVVRTKSFFKNSKTIPLHIDEIYIFDKHRKPTGKVSLTDFMRADDKISLQNISSNIEAVLQTTTNQADVLFAFRTYALKAIPIVDVKERLVGVVHLTDIIDLIYSESQDEFLHSGGVEESDFYDTPVNTSIARLKWLSFSIIGSLITAILIGLFQKVIARNTMLVPLISFITTISSIAGIQVVTVNIRALINRELNLINLKSTFWKEIFVALINSVIIGVVFGITFSVRYLDYRLIYIITSSFIFNFLCSAIVGTVSPIMLQRMGMDPALGASVLLSCVIDILSTLSFLTIATWMLM
jgi:magnesium transporter